MYFAWDSRLERVTNEAVRQYYRDRYHLEEHDLAAVRALVGILRRAQMHSVTAQTNSLTIEAMVNLTRFDGYTPIATKVAAAAPKAASVRPDRSSMLIP